MTASDGTQDDAPPDMQAERDFWAAFEYDAATNTWHLSEGVAPLDVFTLAVKKMKADQAAIRRIIHDPEP